MKFFGSKLKKEKRDIHTSIERVFPSHSLRMKVDVYTQISVAERREYNM